MHASLKKLATRTIVVIGAVAFVVSALAWCRSYWLLDLWTVSYTRTVGEQSRAVRGSIQYADGVYVFGLERGGLPIRMGRWKKMEASGIHFVGKTYPTADMINLGWDRTFWSRRGFVQQSARNYQEWPEYYHWQSVIGFPCWLPTLIFAVPPILTIRRWTILRHRRRLGRCEHCGYDLRGSPERCPECGTSRGEARMTSPEVRAIDENAITNAESKSNAQTFEA